MTMQGFGFGVGGEGAVLHGHECMQRVVEDRATTD